MEQYIAALDQGTSSTRCLIFDRGGRAVACAQREHRQYYPRPGWVEHDPMEILANAQAVMAAALGAARLRPEALAALGIANQRETTVVWDGRSGQPLHPAIVWQDMRVERMVEELGGEARRDRFRARTGLPLSTYFSGLKLRWLLENVAGLRARAEAGEARFGTIDSWLAWNLTGGAAGGRHVTDVTNASRTQLMNLAGCTWDPAMLAELEIPAACLPEIRSSSEVYGEVRGAPLPGVRLAGMLGDQQAALVGQACFAPGEAKNTYGTGCFLLLHTGTRPVASNAGLLTTPAYQFGASPPCYALEGAIAIAGALVQWLRDNLQLIRESGEIEALARAVPDNGGVFIVPAFSGLYSPYWNAGARGLIAGLTRFSHRHHLARAALEATAYQVRDVLEAMQRDSGIALDCLKADGGMVVNELLMQFQSDLLGRRVVRPRMAETTALGAAYAAGLAVGYWRDPEELRAHWEIEREWKPVMAEAERERLYAGWKKAVGRSLDWSEDSRPMAANG